MKEEMELSRFKGWEGDSSCLPEKIEKYWIEEAG